MKTVKSVLSATILRIGDVEGRPEEAAEIMVKTSKCTAVARAKGWKKFARRVDSGRDEDEDQENEKKTAYAQLAMRTEYFIDRAEHDEDADDDKDQVKDKDAMDVDEDGKVGEQIEKVEKEQLVRGFKYGTTYVSCPEGQFEKLHSVKGIDICGFFKTSNVCPPSLLILLLLRLTCWTNYTVPPRPPYVGSILYLG